jgi:hypothetical protein
MHGLAGEFHYNRASPKTSSASTVVGKTSMKKQGFPVPGAADFQPGRELEVRQDGWQDNPFDGRAPALAGAFY